MGIGLCDLLGVTNPSLRFAMTLELHVRKPERRNQSESSESKTEIWSYGNSQMIKARMLNCIGGGLIVEFEVRRKKFSRGGHKSLFSGNLVSWWEALIERSLRISISETGGHLLEFYELHANCPMVKPDRTYHMPEFNRFTGASRF